MTATLKEELLGQRSSDITQRERTYTRAFLVISDDKTDTAWDVENAAGLPVIGSTFPTDTTAIVQNIKVKNHAPYAGWTVTCTYSDEFQIDPTDPSNDAPRISFNSSLYSVDLVQDINGKPIQNSSGEPYLDPAVQGELADLIVSIRANVLAVPSWALNYMNSVNDSVITVEGLPIGAELARFQGLRVSEQKRRADTDYYEVTFELHCRKTGWKKSILDAGFKALFDGNQEDIRTLGDNAKVTTPHPLDGAGNAVYLLPMEPGDAVYNDFEIHEKLDFSQLPGVT